MVHYVRTNSLSEVTVVDLFQLELLCVIYSDLILNT